MSPRWQLSFIVVEVTEKLIAKMVKEEDESAELYVSLHGGLDQTFVIKISQT